MPKEKKPVDPTDEPEEIDPAVKEVMEEHTRAVSGRGPSVAKEAQRKRAIVKAAMNAIKTRDERAFSAELRRADVKEGSPKWKNAWEIYRSASGLR
ncbi:MAG: hypothetical protein WBE13_14775 [Candidatus Acidiferrum sp.]